MEVHRTQRTVNLINLLQDSKRFQMIATDSKEIIGKEYFAPKEPVRLDNSTCKQSLLLVAFPAANPSERSKTWLRPHCLGTLKGHKH